MNGKWSSYGHLSSQQALVANSVFLTAQRTSVPEPPPSRPFTHHHWHYRCAATIIHHQSRHYPLVPHIDLNLIYHKLIAQKITLSVSMLKSKSFTSQENKMKIIHFFFLCISVTLKLSWLLDVHLGDVCPQMPSVENLSKPERFTDSKQIQIWN